MSAYCIVCGESFDVRRLVIAGFRTCKDCGESEARKVCHTVAPMHKSNYVVVSDQRDLVGINTKGGI